MCRCAGKKLHGFITEAKGENDFVICRFKEECIKHAKLCHPNIVQLLGVHTRPNLPIPMLIMEYMPFSLAKCLEKYKNIPVVVKYNILLDASIGLRFLHEQAPPIIHRDLTANNVMLTADMRAKIADFGQAKIISTQLTPMTVAPGTSCYMPPETLTQNPRYNEKMDIFSFGVLTIHTMIQECPIPSEVYAVDPNVPGRLNPLSEVDRRQAFIEQMGESSIITSLAKQCLDNDPKLRPELVMIITKLKELVSQSPPAMPSKNLLGSIKMIEESTARISLLESSLQNIAVQLEAVLGDIQPKVCANQTGDSEVENLPSRGNELAGLSVIEKQLKSMSHLIQSLLTQKELQGEHRLAMVYYPSEHKAHSTSINLERSISGSVKVTAVIQPPINISFTGTYIKTILSGLRQPMSVAVSKKGLVYVCDELGWKAVHIYNPKDENVKTMVDSTSALGIYAPDEKCWHPSGIAVDQDGNILLSDTDSHRVLKFSSDGTLLATLGNRYSIGAGEGEFNKPKGIAVASSGDVYVCDKDNHRIQVLNSELQFKFAFGRRGSGPAEFYHPRDVAFDSAGNIYVVDSSNLTVKVFTPSFKPLHQIGSKGNQYYHFRAPMNICIDSNDLVYVTDRSKYCVMVFDSTGVFKMSFGKYGKFVDGLFNHPMGISVDALGHVYVCDKLNGCVQMFV